MESGGNISLLCLLLLAQSSLNVAIRVQPIGVQGFPLRYTLQGIPLGLGQVFPMILKDRGATMSELGIFSLHLVA